MAGPGDLVFAQDALAHGPKLGHGRLTAQIAHIDHKFGPHSPAVKGMIEQ